MLEAAALYLLTINVATFAAFWADKRAAEQHRQRIRESSLLLLAAIGGGPGAIAAQQVLRHKTRKEPFRMMLWLIGALQATAAIAGAVQFIAR